MGWSKSCVLEHKSGNISETRKECRETQIAYIWSTQSGPNSIISICCITCCSLQQIHNESTQWSSQCELKVCLWFAGDLWRYVNVVTINWLIEEAHVTTKMQENILEFYLAATRRVSEASQNRKKSIITTLPYPYYNSVFFLLLFIVFLCCQCLCVCVCVCYCCQPGEIKIYIYI